MIFKSFELEKINLKQIKIILLYGKNDGLKKLAINKFSRNKINNYTYDEKEILENEINFFENTLNKSLFETEKIIIINRSTNKITNIMAKKTRRCFDYFKCRKLGKIKLRSTFEKNKYPICIPFADNDQTLNKLAFIY